MPHFEDPGQVAVLLACAVMSLRVAILAGVVGGPAVVEPLLLPMAAMVLVLLGASGWIYRTGAMNVARGGGAQSAEPLPPQACGRVGPRPWPPCCLALRRGPGLVR